MKVLKAQSRTKHETGIRKWGTLKMAGMRPYACNPEEDHCRNASCSMLESVCTGVYGQVLEEVCVSIRITGRIFMKDLKANETASLSP